MNVRRLLCGLILFAGAVGLAKAEDANDNPLADAKVGEWMIQKSTMSYPGMAPMTNYSFMWVSGVDGKKITVSTQAIKEDLKTGMAPANAYTVDLGAKTEEKADAPKPKVSDDNCEVKGKSYKCKKYETVTEVQGMGKITTISWVTNDLPVYGTAKSVTMDKDGKETNKSECIDWGMDGGKEKPVG